MTEKIDEYKTFKQIRYFFQYFDMFHGVLSAHPGITLQANGHHSSP